MTQMNIILEKKVSSKIDNEQSGTFIQNMKLPIHRWFRYSAGFAAKWVENIINDFNPKRILDPFVGSGTVCIEADKRGKTYAVRMTYGRNNEERFFIPENVYLIGTMNTADRSLAFVDYALRRRFSFFSLEPQFNSPKFQDSLARSAGRELTLKIVERMNALNRLIAEDKKNLGSGYRIGHSFFCPPQNGKALDESWYRRVIKLEIVPLLEEYWFDDQNRMRNASFLDYRMPVASDLPMIETVLVEVPNPSHPYGVRGVGEVPIVPPLGAVANAIYDAVGVRVARLPASPAVLLEELLAQNEG